VSGFSLGLVMRARGGDGAAFARARRAPRFVPATTAGDGAAESVLLTAIGADPPSVPEVAPASPPAPAASGDESPAAQRAARPAAVPVTTPAVSPGRELPAPLARRSGGRQERVAPPAPPRPASAQAAMQRAVARAAARPAAPAPAAAPPEPRQRSERTAAAPIRPTPRPPASLPATSAAAAPRVEVRIGRVEVAAPPPAAAPQPQTRNLRPPAAQRHAAPRPAGAAFGELAAARRHVDRIAR
jgi:hypothetical protein